MEKSVADTHKIYQRKAPRISWSEMEKEEQKSKKINSSGIRCLKIVQKAIYILALFILILILIVQIYNCILKFMMGPTYVETKIAPQNKALFPAMTICPVTAGYKEGVLKVFKHSFILIIY